MLWLLIEQYHFIEMTKIVCRFTRTIQLYWIEMLSIVTRTSCLIKSLPKPVQFPMLVIVSEWDWEVGQTILCILHFFPCSFGTPCLVMEWLWRKIRWQIVRNCYCLEATPGYCWLMNHCIIYPTNSFFMEQILCSAYFPLPVLQNVPWCLIEFIGFKVVWSLIGYTSPRVESLNWSNLGENRVNMCTYALTISLPFIYFETNLLNWIFL